MVALSAHRHGPVGDRQRSDLPGVVVPAFVGREREVAALGQALSQPSAVVLVEAEPGGGKSRLVQEFLASPAGRRRRRMLVAVCPPYREALTLGPVVDAVRGARDSLAGLRLSPLAGALGPLFPEWTGELPPPPAPLDDPRAARHRLFRALAELLAAAGVTGLVVEDAHWADSVTLEFLLHLASQPAAPSGTSLVVTYRPEEVPADSLLRRLSARPPAGTARVRLELAPLDQAGTAGMVCSMLRDGPVADTLATYLYERTGGVPLAVEESVRLLRDRAGLVRRNGQWERHRRAELPVSPTIRDSVRERVQRLGPVAQQVLRSAAVVGEVTDVATVATVAGLTVPAAEAALTEAVAAGLLREDSRGRLAFRHVFLGQAVYEAVPGAHRRALHRQAGQALAAAEPLPVAALTRHFREAGEVAQWCRYAEQAAQRAVASDDQTTATVLLDELLVTAGPDLPAATVAGLARQLATAALHRGEDIDDLQRQVARTLDTVLGRDGLDPLDQGRVRGLLGRLLGQLGDLAAAQVQLARAVPDLAGDPVQAARAMTYLGWPQFGPGPAQAHLDWLAQAAGLDARIESEVDREELLADRATALLMLGEEAGWELAASLPLDGAPGRPHLARGCLNIGSAAIGWGRYPQARQWLETGLKLADSHRHQRIRAKILMSQADVDWFTGQWDGLDRHAAGLLESGAVDPMVHFMAARLAGRLEAARGALDRADRLLGIALQEARQLGSVEDAMEPAALLGRLRLADGQVAEALLVTEEPMQVVTSKGIWNWATDIGPVRVAALRAAGRIGQAEELVAAYAGAMRGRRAPAPLAGLATCRAILAGDALAYDRAARAWDQLPRPYAALLTREQQARSLLAAGRTEPGLALLSQVREGLSSLGARRDADRVAGRLREHGVAVRQPWRGGRRGYGSQLSPREREVVRLVLAGKTNREIAQVLSKSPRTVAGQLGSVMRKLGVSTRTELAVRVVEAGIHHQ